MKKNLYIIPSTVMVELSVCETLLQTYQNTGGKVNGEIDEQSGSIFSPVRKLYI